MTNTTPENPLAEFANVTRQNIVGLGPEIDTDNVVDINPTIRQIKKSQRQAREQERQHAVDDELTIFSETAFYYVNAMYEATQKHSDYEERTVLRSTISNLVESGDLLSGVEGNPQELGYIDSLVDQLYPREDGFGGTESEASRRVRIATEVVRPAIFGEISLDDGYLDHQALAA